LSVATFVLISGAWHAGWCWGRVVPLLEASGHRVIAPDLLGMGEDLTPLSNVTLARWANQVAKIVLVEPEPVILVGHSRGGVVISETAERVPSKIRTLVYLSAFLLADGETLAEILGLTADTPSEILEGNAEGTTTILPEQVGPIFFNTTSEEWVATAKKQLGPEPMTVFFTPLKLTPENFGRVPRAYIECLQDRAVPLELQRTMQAKSPCKPILTLDTDHSPFYSAPDQLADRLNVIAA
jgi:pimeloyl-ACP methyl ester carboxylesterase